MPLSLESVPGLGPKTVEYLRKQNITTLKVFVKSGIDHLKQAPGFGVARAESVIAGAAEMLENDKKLAKKSAKKDKAKKEKKNGKKNKKAKEKNRDKKKDKKNTRKDKKKK